MLHTNNQIIKHKVGLLNLAEELQNVSPNFDFISCLGHTLLVVSTSAVSSCGSITIFEICFFAILCKSLSGLLKLRHVKV